MVSTFFNTRGNLNYVGQIPDVSLYGVDEMSASEKQDILAWYDREKHRVLDNRRVMEDYCQDDYTLLREACTIPSLALVIRCCERSFKATHDRADPRRRVQLQPKLQEEGLDVALAHGASRRMQNSPYQKRTRIQTYRRTVWTVIVTRQGPCTSFWGAIFTVIPVATSGITVRRAVTLWS